MIDQALMSVDFINRGLDFPALMRSVHQVKCWGQVWVEPGRDNPMRFAGAIAGRSSEGILDHTDQDALALVLVPRSLRREGGEPGPITQRLELLRLQQLWEPGQGVSALATHGTQHVTTVEATVPHQHHAISDGTRANGSLKARSAVRHGHTPASPIACVPHSTNETPRTGGNALCPRAAQSRPKAWSCAGVSATASIVRVARHEAQTNKKGCDGLVRGNGVTPVFEYGKQRA